MVALVVGTHEHVDSFLDGHKGYLFDAKTGHLKELRLGTATETTVELVPSVALQAEENAEVLPQLPLFGEFSDEMLLRLGVPKIILSALETSSILTPFNCITVLQDLAEVAQTAADALLAFATGNLVTRRSVIDLALGNSVLVDEVPKAALEGLKHGWRSLSPSMIHPTWSRF